MLTRKIEKKGEWGLARISHYRLIDDETVVQETTGRNVDVYVLDTGAYEHVSIKRNLVSRFYDHSSPPSDPSYGIDENGHGTAICSVIVKVAPDVLLHVGRVYDRNGAAYGEWLRDGLAKIDANVPSRPFIVYLNMCNVVRGANPKILDDIDALIGSLYAKNGVIVVPVPQNGRTTKEEPFVEDTRTFSIASIDSHDRFVYDFSTQPENIFTRSGVPSVGPGIDFLAPGFGIVGAAIDVSYDRPDSWKEWYGNTFAAAHFVGIAALYMEKFPSWTPDALRDHLVSIAYRRIEFPEHISIRVPLAVHDLRPLNPEWNENDLDLTVFTGERIDHVLHGGFNPDVDEVVHSLSSGAIPPHLVLESDGRLHGIVSKSAAFYMPYVDYTSHVTKRYGLHESTRIMKIRVNKRMDEPPVWDVAPVSSVFENGDVVNLNIAPLATDPDGSGVVFTLLNGDLPPGLTLSANGTIKGTVSGPLPDVVEFGTSARVCRTYEFTVRASDGTNVADKRMVMTVCRDGTTNTPPVFGDDPYDVNLLLSARVGDPVSYVLMIGDPDGNDVISRVISVSAFLPLTSLPSPVHHGLPPGVNMTLSGEIKGIIDITTNSGIYVFAVEAWDGYDSSYRIFGMRVD